MASPIPLIDDDDEFDWDAAVREIDVACQSTATIPFQTPPQPQPPQVFWDGQNCNLKQPQKKNSRQSTLDNFVSNGTSSKNQDELPEDNGSGCYVEIDPEAAKTWVYPDNVPRREYQLAISKTALFSNTLVALPTGLGKTLIAAVVMYNYFRWFPEGKIVFTAPSRPLVMQQIEACHNIVGIPQEWTIDMTGLTSPLKRASLWKSKRVFFVTPQVLEKDIQSGSCLVKYLVCLVIDEAHRAMGNYSYCVAVRELMASPVNLRILALTATPGSKQETIQQVIDNLQISTLEYRSESDHDVCPYVHNRKIELTEVPMGKPATEIHNLFLEVIRPIASKLSSLRLLQPRDVQTLSACDLLNSRDKFRQAPPPELSHLKYSEVEGYFGVLITLYHIRKLLTSHGIRPASEMLEEKLRQGYFARYMSRNEIIQRAKLLMEQNLSHGAPSPKLSKMMEVLVDHFKTNDPQSSRVIIFSNFRGSVRDILDTLANIGNAVKATQFIGQNSGKSLKGQTQKIQQAVLEKFRTGGYNVIVATSIGEEGLDIMEVDLVICFDANVSPLRMIQRMGRTGRKHDGRVVVLACEGSELKGYMRKQATGRTVKKHMQNGGMNSFNFHSSPRMVPHSMKPEVQFQELSIEKFVRHTKKAKTVIVDESKFCDELTEAEASLLGKYFLPDEKPCRPSLIAFPHFQAFPSRVHRVMHSSRTGWLIDVMQLLQGLPFPRTSSTSGADYSWSHGLATENIVRDPERGGDILEPVGCAGTHKEIITSEVPNSRTIIYEQKCMLDHPGRLLEMEVLPTGVFSAIDHTVPDSPIQNGCDANSAVSRSQLQSDAKMFEAAVDDSIDVHFPPFDERYHSEIIGCDPEQAMAPECMPVTAMHSSLDIAEFDFSPRLTNLIENGFVPESPLSNSGSQNDEGKKEIIDPELNVPPISHGNNSTYDELVNVNEIPKTRDVNISPVSYKVCTPLADGTPPESPSNHVFRTPLQNLTNSSCSKDWILSSGEKTRSVEHPFRLKRLRKIGDLGKDRHNGAKEKATRPSVNLALRLNRAIPDVSNRGRVKRQYEDARDFIDVEAEVSSDDVVQDSENEGDHEDSDSYEDSFIDDRIEPTIGTTSQADSAVDMMAIYRRSLLTQSPFQGQQHDSTLVSPQSIPTTKGGESSGRRSYTVESPHSCSKYPNISAGNDSTCPRLSEEKVACKVVPSTSGRSPLSIDSRRRKMVSTRTFVVPAKNLEKEFSICSGVTSKEPSSYEANANDPSFDVSFSDDKFYEGVDLDALEAEATKLLSQRKGSSVPGKQTSEHAPQNSALFSAPSFDLGIL